MGGVCACGACVFFFVVLGLVGSHAFNNKDPEHCWVVTGVERPALTRDEVISAAGKKQPPIAVPDGEPIDYHHIFVRWFTVAFFLLLAPLFSAILLMVIQCMSLISEKTFYISNQVVSNLLSVVVLLWSGLGLHRRLSPNGKIAVGALLERKDGVTDKAYFDAVHAASEARGYQITSKNAMIVFPAILLVFSSLSVIGMAYDLIKRCCCKPEEQPYQPVPQ